MKARAVDAGRRIKSAISKVLGIYDATEHVIHIDDTVGESKQTFLKLHETGHHEMPAHRKIYRLFQDCEKTLAPEIADQFDREANNFARFALFQGDAYARMAADHSLAIKTPMKLARKFGASVYASRVSSRAPITVLVSFMFWSRFSTSMAMAHRLPSGGLSRPHHLPRNSAVPTIPSFRSIIFSGRFYLWGGKSRPLDRSR